MLAIAAIAIAAAKTPNAISVVALQGLLLRLHGRRMDVCKPPRNLNSLDAPMEPQPTLFGSVVSMWRYPVKSMLGEELNASAVGKSGLVGDRGYGIIDAETGKVASAKNPKKWPRLFDFRANYVQTPRVGAPLPPVRITLPSGEEIRSDDPTIHETLSRELGREVRLGTAGANVSGLEEFWPEVEGLAHQDQVTDEPVPTGTFFDVATVHLLTTSTLDRLRMLYPAGRFEVRRFRPNIVVASDRSDIGFAENTWGYVDVMLGSAVKVHVDGPCGRCVMTTLPQADLPHDLGILRTAVHHNHAAVGVYASVVAEGVVRRDDHVTVLQTAESAPQVA